MQNSVTNRQLFFIIFIVLTAYTSISLPSILAKTTGRSSWVFVLIVALVFALFGVIISKLNQMFLGKALFTYSKEIVGTFFSKAIVVYFVFYFLGIAIFLKINLVETLKSNFLPNTPAIIVLFLAIALFSYAAYKGITNIARMVEIYGILFLVVTVLICLFMFFNGTKYNVLPIFNKDDIAFFPKSLPNLIFSFGGLEVLFIIPFTKSNKSPCKTIFLTLIFVGVFYAFSTEATFTILGINNSIMLNDAFIEAIKITEFPIVERPDIFYLTFGLTSLFSGMIIVFTALLEFICELFPKLNRMLITFLISVLLFVLVIVSLEFKNLKSIFENVIIYFVIVSCFVIPSLLLIIAKIKNRKNKIKELK
jgi:spore germination protein (amino acid permease)